MALVLSGDSGFDLPNGAELAVGEGGTGANNDSDARVNLGLGNVDNVSASDLRDRSTHTGTQTLSTISDAGTIASQDANSVNIDGGTIDGTAVNATDLAYSGTLTGGTGVVNLGSGQVYKDASGNVGIGTSSPITKLDVRGSAFQFVQARFNNGSSGNDVFIGEVVGTVGSYVQNGARYDNNLQYKPTRVTSEGIQFNNGVISFRSNTGLTTGVNFIPTERMRIDSSGNVGIGTTSPQTPLQIAGGTDNGSVQDYITLSRTGYPTANFRQVIAASSGSVASQNNIVFKTSDGTNAAAERMRITGAGNVGIGHNDPSYAKLHVRNDASGGNDNFVLMLQNATTVVDSRVGIMFSTNNGQGAGRDGAAIQASNNGVDGKAHITFGNVINNVYEEKVRFTTGGNVGIGTTAPREKLDVRQGKIAVSRSGGGEVFSLGFSSSFTEMEATIAGAIGFKYLKVLNNNNGQFLVRKNLNNGYPAYSFLNDSNTGIGNASGTSDTLNLITGGAERMRIDSSGAVSIVGSLSKGSGSFKIDHPLKPETHHLVHSFVEGPQADLIYRGKVSLVNGHATVNIDEAGRMTEGTFESLNCNVQCFTNNESGWCCVRGSVSGNILTIEAQDETCTDEISWMVIGERCDQHMIDTDWTDENGRVITEPEKEQQDAD